MDEVLAQRIRDAFCAYEVGLPTQDAGCVSAAASFTAGYLCGEADLAALRETARKLAVAAERVVDETVSRNGVPYTYDPGMWTIQALGDVLASPAVRALLEETKGEA